MIAGTLEIQLLANMARLQKDMDDAKRAVGGAMADIEKAVGFAKQALVAFAGVATAGAFANMVRGSIEAAAGMHDLSIQTGASVASLMAFKGIAATSNTSIDGIAGSMNKFAKNLAVANEESKGAGQAVKAIGLDFASLKSMKPEDQMLAVAKALDQFENGAGKSAVAMTLFGKEGAKMLPFLQDLADESGNVTAKLTKQEEEARKAQANMADAFTDNLTKIKKESEAWKKDLSMGMLPALYEFTQAFRDVTTGAGGVKESISKLSKDGTIAEWTRSAIYGVTYVMDAFEGLKAVVSSVGNYIGASAALIVEQFSLAWKVVTGLFKSGNVIDEINASMVRQRAISAGLADNLDQTWGAQTFGSKLRARMEELKGVAVAGKEAKKALNFDANGDGKDSLSEYQKITSELSKQMALAEEELKYGGELAASVKLQVSMGEKLTELYVADKISMVEFEDAYEKVLAIAEKLKAVEDSKAAQKSAQTRADALNKERDAIEKYMAAESERLQNEAHGAEEAVRLANLQFDSLGLLKSQIAELTLARLQDKTVNLTAGTEAYESLQRQIVAQQELIGVLRNTEAKEEAISMWKSIDSTAHDVFVNIFEGGQSAFKKLGNVLKATLLDWLYQMTVKKWIISIGASMSGGSALAGGGGAMGLGGTVNSAMGLNTLYGAGAQWLGGASAGASSLSLGYANAVGAVGGDSLGALISANGGWAGVAAPTTQAATGLMSGSMEIMAGQGTLAGANGAVAASATGAGGISGALAAVPVWGWIALAAIAIASQAKGETRSGGQYSYDSNKGVATLLQGPSGGEIKGDVVRQSITGTVGGINGLLKAMGSSATLAGFQAGLESSDRGRGGVFSGGTLSTGQTFGENGLGNNYEGTLYEQTSSHSVDANTALENFTTDLMQGTIQALQAAGDIPKTIADMVQGVDAESLGKDAATALVASIQKTVSGVTMLHDALETMGLKELSFDAAAGLIAAAGDMDKLGAGLSSYYDSWYTDAEKAANSTAKVSKVFEGLGLTMPDLSAGADAVRETFRAMVDGAMADTTAKGQQTTVALLGVSSALAGLVTSSASASASVANVGQSVGFDGRTVLGTADAAQYKADAGFAYMVNGLQAMADVTNAAMRPAGDGGYGTYSEIASRNTSGGGTMPDYTKELADAQNKLTAAQQSATDALSKFTGSLMDFITQMNVTELGANSPEMRLAASRAEYERIYKEVSSGDLSEKDKLTGAAKTFLDASKSYNASGAGFVADEGYIRQTIGSVIESNQAQLNAPAWSAAALTQYGKGDGVAELIEQIKTLNAKIANIERNTGDQVAVAQDAGTQTVEQLKAGNAQQAQALSNAKFEALRNV